MDPKDLLASTRAEFFLAFMDVLQKTFPRCIENLFRKADASYSSLEQGRLLHCRSVLIEQGPALTQQMSRNMESLLNRSFQTTYNTYRPSASFSLNASSLSLIDTNTFEDDLRVDDATKRFRGEAEEQLRDLNIRIALLFGQDSIKERENPFRPYLFSRCITTSVENFGLSADVTINLIDQLTEIFAVFVVIIYDRVNAYLAHNGIAAQLQLKIKKSGSDREKMPKSPYFMPESNDPESSIATGETATVKTANRQDSFPSQEAQPKSEKNSAEMPNRTIERLMNAVRRSPSTSTSERPVLQPIGLNQDLHTNKKQAGWLRSGQTMGGVLRKFFGTDEISKNRMHVYEGGQSDDVARGRSNQATGTLLKSSDMTISKKWTEGDFDSADLNNSFTLDTNKTDSADKAARSGGLTGDTYLHEHDQLTRSVQGMQKTSTPPTSEMFDGQGNIRNLIWEHRSALNEATQNVDELRTIDIVAMLFEFILRDNQVPAEVRAQLGRLQFMVLKIALRDTTLLTQKGHPARVFVNRIGSISLGLKQLDPSGVQITEEICRIVEKLLQDENEHPQLFSKMLDEFDSFIARELRAGDKNIERVVDVVEQVQNRTLRFAHTAAQMSEALSGLTIDPYLQTFLEDTWVLAVEYADRQDTKQARSYRLLVPDLLWSIVPKMKEDDRHQLFALLPIMLNTLREGLTSIIWGAPKQDELMNWLVDAHTSALRATNPATPVNIPSLSAIHQHFSVFVDTPEASAHSNINIDDSHPPESKRFLEEAIKELDIKVALLDLAFDHDITAENLTGIVPDQMSNVDLRVVEDRLHSGVAMEINLAGRASIGQLRWIDPKLQSVIFILEGQMQPALLSVRMLRRMITLGRVRFLESEPVFERAVESLLKSADSLDRDIVSQSSIGT